MRNNSLDPLSFFFFFLMRTCEKSYHSAIESEPCLRLSSTPSKPWRRRSCGADDDVPDLLLIRSLRCYNSWHRESNSMHQQEKQRHSFETVVVLAPFPLSLQQSLVLVLVFFLPRLLLLFALPSLLSSPIQTQFLHSRLMKTSDYSGDYDPSTKKIHRIFRVIWAQIHDEFLNGHLLLFVWVCLRKWYNDSSYETNPSSLPSTASRTCFGLVSLFHKVFYWVFALPLLYLRLSSRGKADCRRN